jgi:hypothetical protein
MTLRRRHRWLFVVVTLLAFVTTETTALAHSCMAMRTGASGGNEPHRVQSESPRTGVHACHGEQLKGPATPDTLCAFHCHEGAASQTPPAIDNVPPCALLHDAVLTLHGKNALSSASEPAFARRCDYPRSRRSISIQYCTFLI